MKKRKAFVFFLTVMWMLFALTPANVIRAAAAEDTATAETFQVYLDDYKTVGTTFMIYLNHNQDSSFLPAPEDITAKLGKTEMQTLSIKRFSEAEEPVTYLCVVDVSGSMDQKRIDEAKTIIKDLAAKKKPSDNLCITALGNELVPSGYKTDAGEIGAAADALTVTKEDTNLYYAISEELKELQTSNEVHDKKCLLIFSDGADDQATGITREEAENAVKDSHIPVFTVGLLKSAENDNSKEMAKILGSFARISAGGMHFAPALKEGTDETIADSILSRLNSSLVLEEDLSDVEISGKEVLLQVEVRNGDQTASDKVNIPESEADAVEEAIIRIEQEREQETEKPAIPAAPAPSPTAPVENEPGSGGGEAESLEPVAETILGLPKMTFFIIVGAAAAGILVLIIILIVVANNRKKGQEQNAYAEDLPEPAPEVFGVMGDGGNSVTQGFGEEGGSRTTMGFAENTDREETPALELTLTEVGKKDGKVYQIRVEDSYTIGRSAVKSRLSMPDDQALSGLHATLIQKDGHLFIRDEKSMNGTFVNGVPISGEFELHQDDILLMGSYEYRVSWEE